MSLKLTRAGKVAAWFVGPVVIVVGYLLLTGSLVDVIGETRCEIALRPRQESEFDSEKWAKAAIEDGTRYPMANWLIKNRRLMEKPAADVLETLGQPSSKHLDGGLTCWDYTLARQSDYPAKSFLAPFGLSNMDYWYLRICFQNDSVADAKIIVK